MLNMGMGEIFVILLIALIIFGPNKLPEMARNLGKAIRAFQAEGQKAAAVLRSAVEDEPRHPSAGVIDRPEADRPEAGLPEAGLPEAGLPEEGLAEPAPEGTERVAAPDGPVPAPDRRGSAPPEAPLDQADRLLEDT